MTTIKYQLARVPAVSIDPSHIIIFHEKVSILSNFICVSAYMTNVIGQYFFGGWHWTVTEWEGEVLEIARISRLDMSAYLCIASNGVPPSVSKRIKVSVDCEYSTCWWLIWHHSKYIKPTFFFPCNIPFSAYSMLCCMCAPTMIFFVRWLAVPPMVWIPQQLVGTPVGYNVTLECFIEAYPISLNYWSKDDSDMIHDSNKYKWVHFKWGLLFRPILDVYSIFKSIRSKVLWYCKLHDIYVSMFILVFFVEYFCITELKRLSIGHRISQQCV